MPTSELGTPNLDLQNLRSRKVPIVVSSAASYTEMVPGYVACLDDASSSSNLLRYSELISADVNREREREVVGVRALCVCVCVV